MRSMVRVLLVVTLLVISPGLDAGKVRRESSSYDIQGICHIEMKAGPDIEGVVLLGRGYDCNCLRYWDSNGFYFIHEDSSSSAILFDRYYASIRSGKIPEDEYVENALGGAKAPPDHLAEWPEHEQVYFLYARPNEEFVPPWDLLPPETLTITDSIDSAPTPPLFKRDIIERYAVVYDLLDYIPVYPRIPEEVALGKTKSVRPRRIPLRDIEKFSIIMRLSEKWAYEVTAANERASHRNAAVRWLAMHSLGGHSDLYSPWENDPPKAILGGLESSPKDRAKQVTPKQPQLRVARSQPRPFDLEAICRIETTDGRTVTGAILIASDVRPGEYEYAPETNGFYFVPAERRNPERRGLEVVSKDLYLFPPEGLYIERGSGVHWNGVSFCWHKSYQEWPSGGTDYYLRDVTIQMLGKSRFRTVQSGVTREGRSLVLRRVVVNHYPNVFEMRDCIPVYTEIPEDGSLREATSVKPTCVPMSTIQSFQILLNPDETWWTRISRSEMARPEGMKQGPRPVKWFVGDSSREIERSLKPWDAVGFDRFHRKLDYPRSWLQ